MKFYLGTHMPSWLWFAEFPLFVSHRRLSGRKRLSRAVCDWALDSGGFTELSMFGEWRTSRGEYVDAVRRYVAEIGRLEWASPQDWMCEPHIVSQTGLSVREHQQRTVENFCELRSETPDLPFIPVLQGWTEQDYVDCIKLYERVGIDLTAERIVGVGSVCRRQHVNEIQSIMSTITEAGIRPHGFGVKNLGLRSYASLLTSADSMAWSYRGRHEPGCMPNHVTEANCYRFAQGWRNRLLVNAASS